MNESDPKTLLEAVRHFSDLKMCRDYMVGIKWPTGSVTCPKCNGDNIGIIETRHLYKCRAKDCRKQFSHKVGTIFEDSPLGLDKWFVAVWLIANTKNGTSSCELARALGVTQKTAWFMLHRIRLAMRTGTFRKMTGTVESDETFVGGKAANMHKAQREKKITGRGGVGKTIVHGLLERGNAAEGTKSRVKATVVKNTEASTLMPEILRNVDPSATVYTDAAAAYSGLASRFVHQFIDHATTYVEGLVHINGMENFWCLLKRMLRGTYVAVAPFHLFRYLDEEAWRFNERGDNDGGRFATVMQGVAGKRLTYRELGAIGDCGFMGMI